MRGPINFDNPTSEERADPSYVCFDLDVNNISTASISAFGAKIVNDLQLRKQFDSSQGLTVRGLQKKLATFMRHEARMKKIQHDVSHGNNLSRADVSFLIIDSLPCSMHGEVRNSIKFVTMLLSSAISRSRRNAMGSQAKAVEETICRITMVMSTKILGTQRKPHHWRLPYDSNKKQLNAISFDHDTTNRLMENIDELIEACLVYEKGTGQTLEEEIEFWKIAMNHYNRATAILNQKTNLTRDEIFSFQFEIDQFAKFYVRKLGLGKEGINNYIHMYISGHYAQYLFRHKSLYRHNQQGYVLL